MKKIVALTLLILAQGAFANYSNCHLAVTNGNKAGIFSDSSSRSLATPVALNNIKDVTELVLLVHKLASNGVCESVLLSECQIAHSNSGALGIYPNWSSSPIAMGSSTRDIEKLSNLYILLQNVGLCK